MVDRTPNEKLLNYFIEELSKSSKKSDLGISIREYLLKKKAYIMSEVNRLHQELDGVESLLEMFDAKDYDLLEESYSNFDGLVNDSERADYSDPNVFRTKEYWRDFSLKMLSKLSMFISSSEIMDASITPRSERRQCMSILSIVLSELCESGKLTRIKVEGERGYYYAVPGTPTIIKR